MPAVSLSQRRNPVLAPTSGAASASARQFQTNKCHDDGSHFMQVGEGWATHPGLPTR